ncbi:MAG: HDOD domain-containing protein [Spirochaetales bacterium]|nr:HDOD domain-containing protein [Spirochaetales bacterium]
MTLDSAKVRHAAKNGIPLVIKTHSLPPQTEADLEEVLFIYLAELGQESLKDHLSYCLKELTVNAKKANTKRVYFQEKDLDLTNPTDYQTGLKTFKQDTMDNLEHYLRLQEKEDLYVKVTFLIRNNTLYISVKNNAPIVSAELTRVYDRIARSRAFESMEEAFAEVLDDSEGAGLGIVIMILMLRKMGLSEKAFDLSSTDTETTATLSVPMNLVKLERVNLIADEFIRLIDSLPPFPDNLQKLLQLLGNPDVDFNLVAQQLARDPALTADLIKYVNSAQFSNRKRIDSIHEAVRLVGMRGVQELIYPYGAHKLLHTYIDRQKSLWEDAVQVSQYAAEMARRFKFDRDTQNQVQIAGLLFNLGQIILSFVHPSLLEKIQVFCREKDIPSDLFENLTMSINTSDIGARIAEKWNFPEDLIILIRYQRIPQNAIQPLQVSASLINIAQGLVSIEHDVMTYSQLSAFALRTLSLNDIEAVATLHDELRTVVHKE